MQWQLRGDRPIYQQIMEKLTEQIVSGQLNAGDKVPPVRELAAPQHHAARPCGSRARGVDAQQPHKRTICNGG